MSKTKAKTKLFPSGWQLFHASLVAYRAHPWRYLIIIGIVAIPTNLIGMSTALSSDPTVALYLNLASLFMTAAILWTVARGQTDPHFKLRQAYYDGAAILVRFIATIAVLALMIFPAAIGLSLYSLGSASNDGSVSLPVQLLLGGLALILALPTLYWLVRYGLSIYRVTAEDDWPIEALKASRQLSLGHFWQIAGRLAQLIVWVALIMALPLFVFLALAILVHAYFFVVLLQISFSLIAIPVIALYTFGLYQALQEA
jgi:hypothetical protein